jgi:hypothetical protein
MGLVPIGLVDLPTLEQLYAHRLADIDRLTSAAAGQDDPFGAAIGDGVAQLAHHVVISLQQSIIPDHFHIIDIEAAKVDIEQGLMADAVEATPVSLLLQALAGREIARQVGSELGELHLEDDAVTRLDLAGFLSKSSNTGDNSVARWMSTLSGRMTLPW